MKMFTQAVTEGINKVGQMAVMDRVAGIHTVAIAEIPIDGRIYQLQISMVQDKTIWTTNKV